VPELPEVEAYRRLAEARALDRVIAGVRAPDAWYLKRGLSPRRVGLALRGRYFTGARRRGKLLLLDTDGEGPMLGLRFGMTGRLLVDGEAGVDRLLYSPDASSSAGARPAMPPRWDRFAVDFEDGGHLRIRDPRRLGGVELDPPEARLGPDALGLSPAQLRAALSGAGVPLKARLLDQSRLAGVGNLIADETLWRAGLSPLRPAGSLSAAELRRLHRHLATTLSDALALGGSHTGELMAHRRPGGVCPKDGTPLVRATVGTRTTWWCPAHQI
jgi:formamidopyrimidine-DNA glycosylase